MELGNFKFVAKFAEYRKTMKKDDSGFTEWLKLSHGTRLLSLRYVGHVNLSELRFGDEVELECMVGISEKDYADVCITHVSLVQ